MAYVRKTRDEWHLEVDYGYGQGYECEVVEDTRVEGMARLREYRANCQYAVRLVKRRMPIATEGV